MNVAPILKKTIHGLNPDRLSTLVRAAELWGPPLAAACAVGVLEAQYTANHVDPDLKHKLVKQAALTNGAYAGMHLASFMGVIKVVEHILEKNFGKGVAAAERLPKARLELIATAVAASVSLLADALSPLFTSRAMVKSLKSEVASGEPPDKNMNAKPPDGKNFYHSVPPPDKPPAPLDALQWGAEFNYSTAMYPKPPGLAYAKANTPAQSIQHVHFNCLA
ncbi:MAG: hypothetical protein VKJ06_05020 [Vampirovibrionales bacterium]|nr:hypothetical protein [Vampirovibrionales bacterium]